jgi:uncharacterized protein YndB with AHSA1/START domain
MSTATRTQYAGGSAVADSSAEPLTVYISRTLRAPRERVFEAWTKPEQLLKWRGPEEWEVLEAISDARPGGQHRTVVRGTPRPASPEQKPVEVTGASWGVYLDVDPYSLVRFTWNADWAPGEESIVTVRLSDADGGTLMDFTHDNFLTPQSAQGHHQGWSSSFRKLVRLLQG